MYAATLLLIVAVVGDDWTAVPPRMVNHNLGPQISHSLVATDPYAEARCRAIAEGKPLVVWSGSAICPPCIQETQGEWVNYVGTVPGLPKDALIVGYPQDGDLWQVATITQWVASDANYGHVPSLRRAIRNWKERKATQLPAQPPHAVQLPAYPMMGFGGPAMMGGGCATCGSSASRGFFRR